MILHSSRWSRRRYAGIDPSDGSMVHERSRSTDPSDGWSARNPDRSTYALARYIAALTRTLAASVPVDKYIAARGGCMRAKRDGHETGGIDRARAAVVKIAR